MEDCCDDVDPTIYEDDGASNVEVGAKGARGKDPSIEEQDGELDAGDGWIIEDFGCQDDFCKGDRVGEENGMFAAAIVHGKQAACDFSGCEDEGRNDHPVVRLETDFADMPREKTEQDGDESKGEADDVGDHDFAGPVIVDVSLLVLNILRRELAHFGAPRRPVWKGIERIMRPRPTFLTQD